MRHEGKFYAFARLVRRGCFRNLASTYREKSVVKGTVALEFWGILGIMFGYHSKIGQGPASSKVAVLTDVLLAPDKGSGK